MNHPISGLGPEPQGQSRKAARSTILFLFTFVLLIWATNPRAKAQAVGSGQIQGTISDSTGAAEGGASAAASRP